MKRTAYIFRDGKLTNERKQCHMTDKFRAVNKYPARVWENAETGKQYIMKEYLGRRIFIEVK